MGEATLPHPPPPDWWRAHRMERDMDAEASGVGATRMVGPTSHGIVRIIEGGGSETAMDLEPEEAEEIADELRAAAERARGAVRGRVAQKDGPR